MKEYYNGQPISGTFDKASQINTEKGNTVQDELNSIKNDLSKKVDAINPSTPERVFDSRSASASRFVIDETTWYRFVLNNCDLRVNSVTMGSQDSYYEIVLPIKSECVITWIIRNGGYVIIDKINN